MLDFRHQYNVFASNTTNLHALSNNNFILFLQLQSKISQSCYSSQYLAFTFSPLATTAQFGIAMNDGVCLGVGYWISSLLTVAEFAFGFNTPHTN